MNAMEQENTQLKETDTQALQDNILEAGQTFEALLEEADLSNAERVVLQGDFLTWLQTSKYLVSKLSHKSQKGIFYETR